ncbi:outer membrane lipoprotein LolB [Oceanospirillum multiglobuliferum]|uniref:Outer-membrane lipoprotein LolB n=2 Tax=Oceanospirillum multiglobuliferum TaxID=64969 RepID=A0A1V4T8E8_9GAMM|nr:outer membrane lipoprotein LolB [Oceanospirillum multiglobuliferum]
MISSVFLLRSLVFLLILMLLLLGGCASTEVLKPTGESYMQRHNDERTKLTHWQMNGKIRVKTADSSDSANLLWQQNGQQYRIILSGPFGQSGATIQGDPYQVQLLLPEKGAYQASTPEQLLHDYFGWNLPLSHLFYWVRTLPAPLLPYQSNLNEQQQLAQLIQDGWEIRYDRYHEALKPMLPGRMKISKGDLQLTLVINQWQLEPDFAQLSSFR